MANRTGTETPTSRLVWSLPQKQFQSSVENSDFPAGRIFFSVSSTVQETNGGSSVPSWKISSGKLFSNRLGKSISNRNTCSGIINLFLKKSLIQVRKIIRILLWIILKHRHRSMLNPFFPDFFGGSCLSLYSLPWEYFLRSIHVLNLKKMNN